MGSENPKAAEKADLLYDAALLQAKVNRLFDYARNEPEEPLPDQLSQEELIGSLKNAVTVMVWATNNAEFVQVIEKIKSRHASKKRK